MKAAYYEGQRTFCIRKSEPVPPGPGQVCLAVAFCGICGTDLHIFHGKMDHRVRRPQVIGHEAAGIVARIEMGVRGFQVGDRVVVRPLQPGAPIQSAWSKAR